MWKERYVITNVRKLNINFKRNVSLIDDDDGNNNNSNVNDDHRHSNVLCNLFN